MSEIVGEVFVFGSNRRGVHGAGAALCAVKYHGAKMGQGEGRQGRAYGIPTKDENIQTLPLQEIQAAVYRFFDHVQDKEYTRFNVTRVGCGLAGYTDEQIAPMFRGAPVHCVLPQGWREINGEAKP